MDFLDLNDQQRKIVEQGDGVVMVKAGPGTGKTKTLISRVAYLILEKHINPANILTLTFTQRAALEMKERLNLILGSNLPTITTFHGLAFNFLTGLVGEIKIISEEDQETLLKKVAGKSKVKISPRALSVIISQHKSTTNPSKKDSEMERLIVDYNKALNQQQLLDFDDLLMQMYKSLEEKNDKRRQLKNLYQYILIDEFQDTNDLQYQIIKMILKDSPNLFVIGDPFQSIYGFRGASAEVFKTLKDDFSAVCEETLGINYRSHSNVVQISNLLFPQSLTLQPASKKGGKVSLVKTLNEYSEADWVIRFISDKIGGTDLLKAQHLVTQVNFSDFAVVFRAHHLSGVLRKQFEESGMPYQIVKEDTPVEGDHIKLLSMHAAKGLEFKFVFICGFEEGLIPYIKNEADLEEEKRLLYVAMTRAKEELYLLYAKKRQKKPNQVSRFKTLLEHPNFLEVEDEAITKIIKKSQISLFN
ncbi:MAG: hypothetical protein UU73_C0001G0293 [Candidatus Daviesbacteria bacterium GW2011_GWA1_41_61]|uniref:DNA 3'-5' helicase n=1 Tax=Candidatus Daviesbacteria bacterium GW2011_GWA2_40_9 TaxID=1618424 RepID=A0A0G0U368_9BACT|nr:MAG: hypothetical protein UU26_C0029G0003 [Candidatus Daviesbacteria bacterium GW2011_GWC1_40_9]KKR83543.1 MAG: hypothetical protein UU29_C0004G0044 [Candidatus Daviesbacteria bacterium GW2011_GWA2_40_9]KKR93112.1 MAG: hypothetical protein UU44_C0004G0294 [Candidatus Daviesbacteria bacterium GW2011_GWB1_41_15]KKS15656.1 MAG: hypothetical protein UU73_C0001G0293 [Candidatus Daviesbacteria bacterium GW2011_GWA1_41_61]